MADAVRDGQTALALRLAKHLAEDGFAGKSKNMAFAPLSIHAALALVTAGARGATEAQLLSFHGAPSAADLAAFGRRVADTVLADQMEDESAPRVLFGGGVWVDASCGGLKKAFRDVATKSYKSQARTVNFADDPEEAVEIINDWVKKATNNLINSLFFPSDINADTALVVATAVYFKGLWRNPFHRANTSPRQFHLLDGSCVKAKFMSKSSQSQFISCLDGFKVLKLPYLGPWKTKADAAHAAPLKSRGGPGAAAAVDADDTQFSMLFFLPDEQLGIANMVDMITAAPSYLQSILPKTMVENVQVTLPKFEISFDWDLGKDLQRLGLSLPFSRDVGDLRGMFQKPDMRRPMFVTKAMQKVIIKVDEAGTEAASIMRGFCGGGLPPDMVPFVADHPFSFLIMEERSGVIVFAGHVLDPTK
ncbi:serpin-ZXA-like [Aegilops tauschii subsp. strangulata]|nr:serpin-ZXA-like [Aegilops tauschii subsp. strangulata]